MKADFDTVCKLEDILSRLEMLNDTIQALTNACYESSFDFPKKALLLPSFELNAIYKEYESICETLIIDKAVTNNAG